MILAIAVAILALAFLALVVAWGREVEPPQRLVSAESWGGDWPETLNTLLLTEEDGSTTCTLTVRYPSQEARDAALQTGMKDGTDQSFDRLDTYLHTTST